MLGCSADHAKRLRLWIVSEAITAVLVACRDDATKREDFRRRCLAALSAEEVKDPTPDLIMEAALADAREDVSRQAATMGAMTEAERHIWIRDLREELGAKADLLRALEGHQ